MLSQVQPESTVYIEPVIGLLAQLCTAQHAVAKCNISKMHIFMMNVGEDDVIIPQGSVIARVTELREAPDTKKESTEAKVPVIASLNPDSSDRKKRLQELLKELKINENILLTKNPKVKASVVRLVAKYLDVFAHEQQSSNYMVILIRLSFQ